MIGGEGRCCGKRTTSGRVQRMNTAVRRPPCSAQPAPTKIADWQTRTMPAPALLRDSSPLRLLRFPLTPCRGRGRDGRTGRSYRSSPVGKGSLVRPAQPLPAEPRRARAGLGQGASWAVGPKGEGLSGHNPLTGDMGGFELRGIYAPVTRRGS